MPPGLFFLPKTAETNLLAEA
jgi:hypothetical protein